MAVHKGSATSQLLALPVGGVIWVETYEHSYGADMRKWNPAKARRPDEMKDWVISTALFTAISHGNSFDVRYLLEIRRLK